MPTKKLNFDVAREIALALPGVEENTLHGSPSLKVRGRLLACPAIHRSVEPDTLAVRVGFDQRTKLMATEPRTYYVTDHYANHPMVLVRLSQISRKSLSDLLRMAWEFVSSEPVKAKSSSPRKAASERTRKSWATKLRPDMKPDVTPDAKGRGQMLLPTPMLVAGEMVAIPHGALCTVSELRLRLARRFKADLTCPLMTGIFYNIIAGAVEDQLAAGQPPLAPYWRVILDDGTLSPKTPAGPEQQAERLRQEGHTITPRRAKLQVTDYRQYLTRQGTETPPGP